MAKAQKRVTETPVEKPTRAPVGKIVFIGNGEHKARFKEFIKLNGAGDKHTVQLDKLVPTLIGKCSLDLLYSGVDFCEPVDVTYFGESMNHDSHKVVVHFGGYEESMALKTKELVVESAEFYLSFNVAVQ